MSAPKVYLDYTQEDLDRAYDQRVWADNAEAVIGGWKADSDAARKRFAFSTHAYGPHADETLDVFPLAVPAPPPGAPVHVHIHGGAWRMLGKDDESFLAACFVPAGAVLVVLNFSLLPQVRLPGMVEQVRRSIAWVHANIAAHGGDPARIHVSGHSSGAHLGGVLAVTDWAARGLPADVVKSYLLPSGMYDLRPVMLSARSSYVKLSEAEVLELSAILHAERVVAPVTLAWGEGESPEFKRQPRAFAEVLRAAGKPVREVEIAGANHFEIFSQLGSPDTPLARLALQAMGLAGAD